MKKIFPVIIALITISVVGLIYLQYSWFENLLLLKKEQIRESGLNALAVVADEFNANPSDVQFGQKPSSMMLDNGVSVMNLLHQPTIAQRFSESEIQAKLEKALAKNGLTKIKFEFGITQAHGSGYIAEMASPGLSSFDSTKDVQLIRFSAGMMSDEILFLTIPNVKQYAFVSSYKELIGSGIFSLFIVFAFLFTVNALLRQKKLGEIKSDFINNMTHEFKTPLATISLAVDALRNEKVMNDREKMAYFSGIIKEENKRMNKHVETILQAAVMDKQEFQLNTEALHAHNLMKHALENHHLQLEEKGAVVELFLNAKNDLILADDVHFTNLLSNLVDNAIKYSKENLTLKIITHSTNKLLLIRIADNGIGMNKETLKRVFEKFYRAHTGNVHNVKGFGLGMSYVKTIIDAHKSNIKVESILGRGTTFTVEIPLVKS